MLLTYDQIINSVYISPNDKFENINKIKILADQNYPIGCAYLAACYVNGIGVEINLEKAFEFYFKSAEQGHPLGEVGLCSCYLFGYGVEINLPKAFELCSKSANQNHPAGEVYLGLFYLNGNVVEQDVSKTFNLCYKSAEQGYPLGEAYLGLCYQYGIGVNKNELKAFEFYSKSAEQGHSIGSLYLSKCYEYGIGTSTDISKVIDIRTKIYSIMNIFGIIISILSKCSYNQLLKIYDISKTHNIKKNIEVIETELKKYQKSFNYIKLAKLIISSNDNIDTCSICYEKINITHIYLTKCLHYFHIDCVRSQRRCPLCRNNLEIINC